MAPLVKARNEQPVGNLPHLFELNDKMQYYSRPWIFPRPRLFYLKPFIVLEVKVILLTFLHTIFIYNMTFSPSKLAHPLACAKVTHLHPSFDPYLDPHSISSSVASGVINESKLLE